MPAHPARFVCCSRTMDNVSLLEQQLREVAAVLSANACSNSRAGRVRLEPRPVLPLEVYDIR
jgi:hypothetical protein